MPKSMFSVCGFWSKDKVAGEMFENFFFLAGEGLTGVGVKKGRKESKEESEIALELLPKKSNDFYFYSIFFVLFFIFFAFFVAITFLIFWLCRWKTFLIFDQNKSKFYFFFEVFRILLLLLLICGLKWIFQ